MLDDVLSSEAEADLNNFLYSLYDNGINVKHMRIIIEDLHESFDYNSELGPIHFEVG